MTAMVVLLIFTAGCDGNKPPEQNLPANNQSPQSENTNTTPENNQTNPFAERLNQGERQGKFLQVKIYYPDDSGMKLVAVDRQIKINKDEDKYFETAKLLTQEPTEHNLTKIFPSQAKINGVTLKRDTAFVNFDSSITQNFVGGSTGEELLINSFVQTLTEFPEVTQVKFLVDGNDIETLSGHMDLSAPLKRMEE